MGHSSLPSAALRDATLALAGTALIAAIGVAGALDYPVAWPDEVLFAAPARALLDDGRLATVPLAGLLPGAERATYWMPPLYFVVLSGWFALAGASLWTMRLLSVAAAAGTLFVVLRLGAEGRRAPLRVSALLVLLVALDPLFVRGALVGRMDMLALFLTCAAVRCASVADEGRWAHMVCGAIAGLAVLAHPLGVAAPAGISAALLWNGAPGARARPVLLFLTGVVAVVSPWAAWIAADTATFAAQMGHQLARKAADDLPSRLHAFAAFLDPARSGQALRVALAGIGLAALLVAARPVRSLRPAAATAVFLALAAVWSGEMWYPLYVVPFAALGLARLTVARPAIATPAAVLVAVALVYAGARDVQALASARHRDYVRWSGALDRVALARLPAGTRVLVNSIPDPAALLMHERPDLAWREFSPVPVADAEYDAFLDGIDVFVVGPTAPDARVLAWLDARGAGWPEMRVEAGGLAARVIVRPGR